MPRTRRFDLRDFAATIVAMLVIFVMLNYMSPQVRERVADGVGQEWHASSGALSHAAVSALAITSSYAADNTYLFSFLVVAVVLFVLMLRT